MKVLFWTGSNDGSSHYRAELPAAALQWSGHSTRIASQRITQAEVEQADVVVVSRPAQPAALQLIPKMRAAGKIVVADMDDDYFSIDEKSNPLAYRFWSTKMRENLVEGLNSCDALICASDGLADALMNRLRPDLPFGIIENGLHAQYLGIPRDYDPEVITLGWAGSQNTAAWIPQMARAVNLALATYPNVRFLSVGIPRIELHRKGIENVQGRVGVVPWAQHGNQYLQTVAAFDIWLAPYSDIPFNRAKVPTKALEAGFLGIPLVASDIQPYRQWAGTQGAGGYLVKHDHEWSRYIARLVGDAQLRKDLGVHGRGVASRNVMQSLGLQWATFLEGMLAK